MKPWTASDRAKEEIIAGWASNLQDSKCTEKQAAVKNYQSLSKSSLVAYVFYTFNPV